MPRIRSIHPDICDDEVLAEVSAYAERTFVRLWTHLDDEGRGKDNATLWKGKLFPLHDDVTSERVERDLTELAARGLLIRYEVDGRHYLCAKPSTWKKYQRPQHPTASKLPEPPAVSRTAHEVERKSRVGGVGSGVVEESSRLGVEGESEGEARSSSRRPQGVGKTLEQRAALHAIEGGNPKGATSGNGAA